MLMKIAVLPGDGIGPEVTDEAVRVLEAIAAHFHHELTLQKRDIGGAALTSSRDPLPQDTLQTCLAADAVLLGAVGGPAFDNVSRRPAPRTRIASAAPGTWAFANLRPAVCFPALEDCSPLRPEVVRGTDILIVRELLGGIYFGEPRSTGTTGSRVAIDTMRYGEAEIERIAHVAFKLAQSRRRQVTSVDKANVLDCSRLWREVVTRVGQEFPEVQLRHTYVDSAAMALVARPTDFDVLLTENMFGDILSDQAGAIVGSIGVLGSASIGGPIGLYEPVHGSAPDIAGKGIANPLGAILSVAMMLRHSFHLHAEAGCVEAAVASVLGAGNRTRDLAKAGQAAIGTAEMGRYIVAAITERAQQAQPIAVH